MLRRQRRPASTLRPLADTGIRNGGARHDVRPGDPGWLGSRPYNWEFSASVQQEVIPRVSVGFGYFRRINGNFQITDNEALTAADFTRLSVTMPVNCSDARCRALPICTNWITSAPSSTASMM